MGKAVKHSLAPRQPRHSLTVVFLVKEKAGFLPVFHVHGIIDPVFADLRDGALGMLGAPPALILLHPFQRADRHIVALENAGDLLPVRTQLVKQQR